MKFITIAFLMFSFSAFAAAQAEKPSAPSKPFYIKSEKDLSEIAKELERQSGNQNRDIVPAKGMQTRIAVFHDEKRENDLYEVHDGADDIYYVLAGKATIAVGGELVDASEISPGEWRSKTVSGGNPFEIKKGDLVMIPRGTVHQRTVMGKSFSMVLIKVFATEQR
jgi:mannose-6-phosphate isomerase-like protein (cupin superfamily)